MTDAISLGEIFITDLNDNDLYDPKIDLVTDSSGKTLSPKEASKKLKAVLKTLRAPGWKDLSLFSAQDYLSSFREAERLAGLGEVDEVDDLINEAQAASGNLPISFNAARADRLRTKAREKAIENGMVEAQGYEKDHNWKSALETLREIEGWDQELQGTLGTQASYDVKEYERLLKASYKNLFAAARQKVVTASTSGQISQTQALILEMTDYANLARKQFSIDLKISQKEIDGWMQDAYDQGIPDLFNRIDALAQAGQVQAIRRLLPDLRTFMANAKKSYGLTYQYSESMLDNVYEMALREGIDDNFKQAEAAARAGKTDLAEKLVALSLEYVEEYNQKYPSNNGLSFDLDQAYDILACAWDSKNCP